MENFKELVTKNRSYRGYDERYQVTREQLEELVEYARLTPSSVNAQPLKYLLACEPEVVSKIQPITKWARALPELELPHKGKCPTAFIVICQDLTISDSMARYQKDIGIVAQTMLLGAVDMGLGGCMIGNFSAAELKAAIGLPDTMAPMLVVAIGKPDEQIVLTPPGADGSVQYYRDEQDVHYVPKRELEDIIL